MNRRQLLAAAAATALPQSAQADPPYLGDMMFRADLSDGRRVTCYRGIEALMAQLRDVCLPVYRGGWIVAMRPFIRRIDRYNRETLQWEFYAGARGEGLPSLQATGED